MNALFLKDSKRRQQDFQFSYLQYSSALETPCLVLSSIWFTKVYPPWKQLHKHFTSQVFVKLSYAHKPPRYNVLPTSLFPWFSYLLDSFTSHPNILTPFQPTCNTTFIFLIICLSLNSTQSLFSTSYVLHKLVSLWQYPSKT